MTNATDQAISALSTGYNDLARFVIGLDTDDLARTSGSSDWTVAQALSHLGSASEINLAALDRGVSGTAEPGPDFNKSVWARWDPMSPGEQATGFLSANETLLARFDELAQRDGLLIAFGHMPQPVDVATAATMWLSEFALHSWDVRVAFDESAELAPEATRLLLPLIAPLVQYAGQADQFEGTVRIGVHTADPSRSFGLVIADAVTLTDEAGPVDAELTAPAEYVIRLVTGRHSPAHTPDSVVINGDAVVLDDLRKIFPGY